MSFDQNWEKSYTQNRSLAKWPWSKVIGMIKRHGKGLTEGSKILELGCGVGANIPFFMAEKMDFYGIEGSGSAVSLIHQQYPQLKNKVVVGDFTNSWGFDGIQFDAILDRGSLCHTSMTGVEQVFEQMALRLKANGYFFGIDWMSTDHEAFRLSEPSIDPYTRTNVSKGTFKGVGRVHFFDRTRAMALLEKYNFEVLYFEHARTDVEVGGSNETSHAAFSLAARKRT